MSEEYRQKYLEEKIVDLNARLKSLEVISGEFTKLSILLEMQSKMSQKQDETLEKISENLQNLNSNTSSLKERVEDLEGEIKSVNENTTINIFTTGKKMLWTVGSVVLVGIGTLITNLFM